MWVVEGSGGFSINDWCFQGAEASNILVGELNRLDRPLSAFIRLSEASPLGDLTEVPVATRFLYILLGPAVSRKQVQWRSPLICHVVLRM